MQDKNFPVSKPLQLWWHVFDDEVKWEKYDGTPLDLLHPSFYWDVNPSKYHTLIHPDSYMFNEYAHNVVFYQN